MSWCRRWRGVWLLCRWGGEFSAVLRGVGGCVLTWEQWVCGGYAGDELLVEGGGAGADCAEHGEVGAVGAGVVLFWGGVCCAVVSTNLSSWYFVLGDADGIYRRRQVLIRERLKFPSGFSTAVLISVLHGKTRQAGAEGIDDGGFASLVPTDANQPPAPGRGEDSRDANSWRRNVQLLLLCFFVSGVFTFATYFFPVLRNLPIFGSVAASTWLWTLNPSLAYVGQGIIMGPATTLHMLIGAAVGWGVLSPLAKYKGWASGSVDDWEHGSKGWIVWISLAIMLADSIVSLGHLALRSCVRYFPAVEDAWTAVVKTAFGHGSRQEYTSVRSQDDDDEDDEEKTQDDAPPEQQISDRTVGVGLVLSIVFCIACIHIVFGNLVPLYATVTAVFMALVLSIMGVRALGETDLNPVSGISKLAQLFFAFIIPQSNKSSVLINLVAGAVVCIPSRPSFRDVLANTCVGSPRRYVFSDHHETENEKLTTVTGRPPSRRSHARPQDGASPRRGPQRPVLGPSHRCDRRCRRQRLYIPTLHIVRSIFHTPPVTTTGTDPTPQRLPSPRRPLPGPDGLRVDLHGPPRHGRGLAADGARVGHGRGGAVCRDDGGADRGGGEEVARADSGGHCGCCWWVPLFLGRRWRWTSGRANGWI